MPLAETAALRPGSPYGQAKLAAEGYVALYRDLHGLGATSLRFGNVYGPRQGAVGEAGVVSIFCKELVAGGRPTVFGEGTQTRDFVYVGDIVEAILAASDAGATGEFNVGTGNETSVARAGRADGGGRRARRLHTGDGAAPRGRDRPDGARRRAAALRARLG